LFELFFESTEIIPISSAIIKRAVILSRQKPRKPRSLADFIIAATAPTSHYVTLMTLIGLKN